MSEQLKRRLIGASVLISLAIIFVPMLFEHEPVMVDPGYMKPIPKPPEQKFNSSLLQDEVALPDQVSDPVVEAVPEKAGEEPDVAEKEAAEAAEDQEAVVRPKVGLSAWVVQVGSFSNEENALQLVSRLRKAGFDTMEPEAVEIRGKQLYRVRVGPEIARKNADKLVPEVKKVSGLTGKVVRYP